MYKQLILASQSPRRRELLAKFEIPFTVANANIDETLDSSIPLEEAIQDLAYRKAACIFEKHPQSVIIGADTLVVLDGEILGKPREADVAKAMLRKLSGRVHQVLTGVCLLSADSKETFVSVTEVEFYPLSEKQIQAYVDSKEPLDKAGAYGIQDKGSLFVKGIKGDYYTVMGLPIARLSQSLQKYL